MSKVIILILSISALAFAAYKPRFSSHYVYGKDDGKTHILDIYEEAMEMGQRPLYREHFIMHMPSSDHFYINEKSHYQYNAVDGNIMMYTGWGSRLPINDHIVTNIGANKIGVYVFAAEKFNQFYYVADEVLWACLLNVCPQTTHAIGVVGPATTSLQMMPHNDGHVIVVRNADGVKAWDYTTGQRVSEYGAGERVEYQEWFSTKTTHCTGRVVVTEESWFCAGKGNTVFKDGKKSFDVGNGRTVNWITHSMTDEITTVFSGDKFVRCPNGKWPLFGGAETMDGFVYDGMSPDIRYEVEVPSGATHYCGDGVCDEDESHYDCNLDCCPAGASAWPLSLTNVCNVTCGAGHFIPAGTSSKSCDIFVCPEGTVDDDSDPATPCTPVA